jgi:hypothetical protein
MAGILYPEDERGVLADSPLPPGLLSLKNLLGRLMASAPGTAQQTLGASGSGWAQAINTVPPSTEFDKPRPEWTEFLPDLLNVGNAPMKAAAAFKPRPILDHGILSPNGRVSKATRERDLEKLRQDLFGPQGLQQAPVPQPAEAEALMRQAQQLRELAARGMKTKAYMKKAAELEAQAAALSSPPIIGTE